MGHSEGTLSSVLGGFNENVHEGEWRTERELPETHREHEHRNPMLHRDVSLVQDVVGVLAELGVGGDTLSLTWQTT
jgi:hypothetical protein